MLWLLKQIDDQAWEVSVTYIHRAPVILFESTFVVKNTDGHRRSSAVGLGVAARHAHTHTAPHSAPPARPPAPPPAWVGRRWGDGTARGKEETRMGG